MSIPRPTRPDPGLPEKKGADPPPWANSGPLIEMTTFVCPDCGAEDHHGCGTGSLTEQVMVRMSVEMLNALKDDAANNERTVAQTVRHAIKRHLR